ncbi:MAG: hypothetical protein DI536_15155 [Archangium gephyra]|uniref:Uncharacterized protein n=1 Tax=Archangium gephyra TaxID=48 RepID=A0A2W5TG45_9BACT|nr:MAG: hypothetical protein DI536_15155 [Archangium gephyra]
MGQCTVGGGTGGGSGGGTGGGSDGGGGPLTPFSFRTDGAAPNSVRLDGLATPAYLEVAGESAYVIATETSTCEMTGNHRPSSVTRLDTATGWSVMWRTALHPRIKPLDVAWSTDGLTVVGSGEVAGTPSRGGDDAVVVRIRDDGTVAWSRQFGSIFEDRVLRALPRPGGKVLVAGVTGGALEGQVSRGGEDVFLAQLGADGTTDWFRQIGTSGDERLLDVVVLDDDSLMLGGWSSGVPFLRGFDATGVPTWSQQPHIVSDKFMRATLTRWGDGVVWSGTEGSADIALFAATGELLWAADAGANLYFSEVKELDEDRVSLHGVRRLPWSDPASVRLEAFEDIWWRDGGVTSTPGFGGGWPSEGRTTFDHVALGHRSNNTWTIGSSVWSTLNYDVLSMSSFESGASSRTAHSDWLFDGPANMTRPRSYWLAQPWALGFTASGAQITLGEAVSMPCSPQGGWLWIAKSL